MKSLIKWLDSLFKEIPPVVVIPPPPLIPQTNKELLLIEAYKVLGTDITPNDKIPDEVACSEVLCTLIKKVIPDFPIIPYTPNLLKELKTDNRFKEVFEFKEGNVILSPTGSGNGTMIGHTGICVGGGKIQSNNSDTGLWLEKYTQLEWIEKYSRQGKLKLYLFELL